MPVYEFRCDACGNEFTVTQPFSAPPVERCPRCGARPRKLVSSPAIVFKGSGWHITDYRKADPSEAGKQTEPAPEKKTEPAPERKTERAPEQKTGTKPDGKTDAKGASSPKPKPHSAAE